MTKLSIVNNSIGGKQREQGGSLTFSPDWMILPKTIILKLFPYSFLFLLYNVHIVIHNTKFQVIKSQNRRKSKAYTKIVLPFL